ncbi:hypothetical protein caldi_30040 [Caldinitratiruptor microaerophilus]|uniref:Uncharacterized protein n=1 Tax=Caldinitratiruptor microaerophilus TaxID=671077 RepID=A0AA35CNS9_9FIRM|nr:hypothetical protein caldi_30040 [Caldinitratiruptor microaerophilus]
MGSVPRSGRPGFSRAVFYAPKRFCEVVRMAGGKVAPSKPDVPFTVRKLPRGLKLQKAPKEAKKQ